MIFLLIEPAVPRTPKPRQCIQFYHYIPLIIIQVGTPPQVILDNILLQPHQKPSLQSISLEVKNHQQPSYLSHPLKVQHHQ